MLIGDRHLYKQVWSCAYFVGLLSCFHLQISVPFYRKENENSRRFLDIKGAVLWLITELRLV